MGLSSPAIYKPKWQYHLVGQLNTVNVQNAHKWTDRPWRSWSLQVWSPPARWSTASRRTTILSTLVRWSRWQAAILSIWNEIRTYFPRKVWRSHSQCKRGHICTWWEDNLHPGGNRPKKHRTQKKHKIEWFTITWHCCYKTHWNPLALLHIRLNQCNKENKPM